MTRPLHVLVIGASGFIGRHVTARLLQEGHSVTAAGRVTPRMPGCRGIPVDMGHDDAATWQARLHGIDAVVNAVGLLRGNLDGVQRWGAIALFNACAAADVPRVLQISALGAGVQSTAFLATKAAADAHLLELARSGHRAWCVLRPSLVIGRGGVSTGLFAALAALPRPVGLGAWRVQPVHVDDVARAALDLLTLPAVPETVELVGPAPMTTDALTLTLRNWLGLWPRGLVPVPTGLLRAAAWLGTLVPGAPLSRDSLRMLEAGNTADPAPAARVLGWKPRSIEAALLAHPAMGTDRLAARLLLIRPVLLVCLAAIWIGTGLVSLRLGPVQAEVLLAPLGLSGWVAMGTTAAGALLDLVLGLALFRPGLRRMALSVQLLIMLGYTVLASVAAPDLWLDPFGPLLKNLGVLAASLALLAMEEP